MLYRFPCGCQWPMLEEPEDVPDGCLPYIDIDVELAPENCPATWGLLGRGDTKGVFQLESPLGRQWTKKLKPENGEHIGALGAILRPGCIGGDTTVAVSLFKDNHGRRFDFKKVAIRDLCEQFKRNHFLYQGDIVSLDETSLLMFNNKIENVWFSGDKDVYRVRVQTRGRAVRDNCHHNLECTLDHPLLTHDRGWVMLQDLLPGERVAIVNNRKEKQRSDASLKLAKGEKYFRDICWRTYQYRCVMCDWRDGSLDVNHLSGNRKTNNEADNLCYLCPNHHRMYSEGSLSESVVRACRERLILKGSRDVLWVEFVGKDRIGVKDTYDITVVGPHRNFLAGNFFVHNCLKAVDEEGVSATQHYVRRKNGLEPVKSVHPAVDAILFPTYGVMVYQEQAMAIAQAVAGFNLQDADVLRKAIGKKLPEEMAKCEKMFLEGAERTGVVPMGLAKYLFEQIKESQRYSFNKSHSICYGLTGYECAYLKAHIPVSFFASWLLNSRHKKSKGGPKQEVFELVNDARLFDVKVEPPRLARLERFVYTDRTSVFFGLSNVSGIGPNVVVKVCDTVREAEKAAGSPMAKWTWMQFLLRLGGDLPISSLTRLIQVGAVPYENMQRTRQLVEFEAWTALTDRERGWIGANAAGAKTVMEAIGLLAQPRYVKPERVRRPKAGMEAETKRLQEDYDREDISKEDAKANRAAYRKVTEMYQEPEPKGPFGGCATESRRTTVLGIIRMLERPATAMVDSPLRIACWEEELLGISITYARIDGCDISDVNATCKECVSGRTGSLVLGVDVQEVRETKTKKGKNPGQKMGRMVLSDNTCAINAVCFPNEWKEFQHLFVKDNSLIVQGEREKNNDYDSFIVKRAWQASQSVSGA